MVVAEGGSRGSLSFCNALGEVGARSDEGESGEHGRFDPVMWGFKDECGLVCTTTVVGRGCDGTYGASKGAWLSAMCGTAAIPGGEVEAVEVGDVDSEGCGEEGIVVVGVSIPPRIERAGSRSGEVAVAQSLSTGA